jgi:hypothetical protein
MNGSERRKRQLDSLRTLSPVLVALPVPCDTASLAGGRVPMSSRSEVHRSCWWSRHERQPAELQALREPYAGVRAARRVLREHQGLRCAEAAWENGGGTGEHGGRRELADGRRTAARHVDKAVKKPGMGRVQRISEGALATLVGDSAQRWSACWSLRSLRTRRESTRGASVSSLAGAQHL